MDETRHRKAAERGDAAAQHRLGLSYYFGLSGLWTNRNEAIKWCRRAAEQGHAEAQHFLGARYKNGDGVDTDLNEAVKWYRKSAEQGNKGALKSVFKLAMRGTKAAFDALLALAQENNVEAQNMVGWCYECGKGVSRDVNEAIKWYRKAAEQGDQRALENVQYCVDHGSKESFIYISKSTAAELSFREASPFIPIESFESSVTNPSGLLLSPDDKLIVVFRDEEPAMTVMFDAFTWKEKWRQENSIIRPQAFSPDNNFLLVCCKDSPTAAILDANTGALVRELSGHTGTVNAAAWSSANLIATGSDDDKTIRISHPDGTLVRELTTHEAAFTYLAFASDANQLFSYSPHFDGIYLWEVAAGTLRFVFYDQIEVGEVAPDGSLFAGVLEGELEFFQAKNKEYVNLCKSFDRTRPITWSPDSKHLIAKNGYNFHIFHFTEEELMCTSLHHSTDISAMAFLSEGDRVVTTDSGGRVQYHLCLLKNALARAPVKITASQIPLSAIPLYIPKPTQSLEEALDRTRVLIERTLLPTSFQNLQRVLQRINDSSLSGIHARVRTENAIEEMFAHISESHSESAPAALNQSITAIESAMQSLLSDCSSVSLPNSLSSFSPSESSALFGEDPIAHAVPAALSKAELDVILRFSHNAHNKLHVLEKVLSLRAASFGEAIVEFDNFASDLRAKSEDNSNEFTEVVVQMKQVVEMISSSDVNLNAMDASTNTKQINKSSTEIIESATTKCTENNQSIEKSNVDDLESMMLLNEIRIPVGKVNDVKLSPDGNILAIAIDNGLLLFDTKSKVELWRISGDISQVAFSPTSTQLAAAIKTEKDIVIFEAMTGARVFTFDGDRGKASTVAWSNSNLIASAYNSVDGDFSILVRHPDGRVFGKYCERINVRDLTFSVDGTRLAVASSWQGFLIIDLCKKEYYDNDNGYFRSGPQRTLDARDVFRTAFSPDGSRVAYTSWYDGICIFDSKKFRFIEFDFSGPVDISWSRNSRFIAAVSPGDDDGNDYFFNILATDGNQFGRDVYFQQKILGDRVVFSPDGSEIITVNGSAGLVQFWTSPLFITQITNPMPSANNDEIPFGQLHVIPPIETHAVEHLFDRITTLIDRLDHPKSFHRLVTLLHQFTNVSEALKISESDTDILVIDSSSSSSSSSTQESHIRKSTFESMLDFVNVNGRKLSELESKLLCQADMFSKASVAYDSFVDELRTASEQQIEKLDGFIAYLNTPPMSADRLLYIKSLINDVRI